MEFLNSWHIILTGHSRHFNYSKIIEKFRTKSLKGVLKDRKIKYQVNKMWKKEAIMKSKITICVVLLIITIASMGCTAKQDRSQQDS